MNGLKTVLCLTLIMSAVSSVLSKSPELPRLTADAHELKFTFAMHRDKEHYDHELWNSIASKFFNLALLCQQSEKDKSYDQQWVAILDSPFKEIYPIVKAAHGIHGNISISMEGNPDILINQRVEDTNCIQFVARLFHEKTYDAPTWKSIIDLCIKSFSDKIDQNKQAWIKQLAPIFSQSIAQCSDASGIHGSIDIAVN